MRYSSEIKEVSH